MREFFLLLCASLVMRVSAADESPVTRATLRQEGVFGFPQAEAKVFCNWRREDAIAVPGRTSWLCAASMPAGAGINSGGGDSTPTPLKTIASPWRRSRIILSCAQPGSRAIFSVTFCCRRRLLFKDERNRFATGIQEGTVGSGFC